MSDKIGRFEIISEIVRTPTGCIYKATDPDSGQTVALKTIRPEALGEQAAGLEQRILEEAETTKPLNSHNIALLYGAGEIDGQFCASMEYIQGKSIAAMLAQQEKFSVWDLQDIARQTCQGLDHAHARKVVHQSLEPGKLLVSWDGTVKILGFGISSLGASAAQASGRTPEALHYMSPEQVRGEPLDARSNLFTLGAILYEMVTDRKAFGGEDADQVRQEITVGMPVAPAQIISKMHPALSELIMKALAKVPDQRYQSGQDLVMDLEKCKEAPAKASSQMAAAQPPQRTPEVRTSNESSEDAAPRGNRAAAAAAGYAGSSAASRGISSSYQPDSATSYAPKSEPGAQDSATMAAAWRVETPPEAPRTSENGDKGQSAGKRTRSFSEVDELPPLNEVYVAPLPAPSVEVAPEPEATPRATMFQDEAHAEKAAAMPPAEMAKIAVEAIRKTPPKLFLYSVAGAVVIILLVIAGISSRIHSDNSDETAAPPASSPAANAERAPAPVQPAATASEASAVAPAPMPLEAVTPSASAARPVISVAPKYSRRRPAKVTPPPAPVVVPGQMTVNSTPQGAQVLVDGHHNPNWVTPFDMTGLAPGQHLVSVSKLGYAPETRTIEVASGSKSFLVVQLAQLSASVFVSSVPAGGQVFIDGKDTGRVTPAQIQIDHPGNHAFMVKKQGFLEENTTASLQAGQTFQFAPVLRALGDAADIRMGGGKLKRMFGGGETSGMGMVSIKTQPKAAQIAVNRHVLDRNSPVEFYLNPGTYVIDITLSGYKSVQRIVNVDKGGKLAIDEAMEPE